MPLQLERRRQFVDAFVEQSHHIIVRAIKRDFSGPQRPLRLNLHAWIGCDDPGSAHPSETVSHAFENPRPIVALLILIIIADKIGYSLPVSVFYRVKEIFCVSLDLAFRPPEPDEIQSNSNGQGKSAKESFTKRDRHTANLSFSRGQAISHAE